MKSAARRLGREQAKEVLVGLDSALGSSRGKAAREAIVKFLNASVPTYSWVGMYAVDGGDLVLEAWAGPA
ncbi:MAG: hypothetical protein JRN42_05710, partial [Nitrososphaerota archaeon]|nr:hypothetical protein [Nitrososphaerota archaeon]